MDGSGVEPGRGEALPEPVEQSVAQPVNNQLETRSVMVAGKVQTWVRLEPGYWRCVETNEERKRPPNAGCLGVEKGKEGPEPDPPPTPPLLPPEHPCKPSLPVVALTNMRHVYTRPKKEDRTEGHRLCRRLSLKDPKGFLAQLEEMEQRERAKGAAGALTTKDEGSERVEALIQKLLDECNAEANQ